MDLQIFVKPVLLATATPLIADYSCLVSWRKQWMRSYDRLTPLGIFRYHNRMEGIANCMFLSHGRMMIRRSAEGDQWSDKTVD